MPVDDKNAEMVNILHDVDHPDLKLGTLYPSMKEFRLAVRQYTINEEFELGITKSDRNRYRSSVLQREWLHMPLETEWFYKTRF
jgi:hypothetical protein